MTNKVRPIGLDIGHHSIKMLQLAVSDDSISVVAAAKAPIQADTPSARAQAIAEAVSRLIQGGAFRGRNVVCTLPNEVLKIKSVRVETADEEKIEELLRTDIAQRFGLDPRQDSIKYMMAGTVQQGSELKHELLVFAADNETIRTQIQMLESVGLTPVGLDAIPCALFRSFERMFRRQDDKELFNIFVDLGNQYTTVVVGRGRDLTFVKQIQLGGEKMNSDISAKLGIDLPQASLLRSRLNENTQQSGIDEATAQAVADAMRPTIDQVAREISLCFRYYSVTFRGCRPGKAVFSGGETYEQSLIDAVKRQLGLEVEIAQPLRGFDLSGVNLVNDSRTTLSEWAVAVGLGLKGFDSARQQG